MSGHFGFSYLGLIYLLMLFIPNFLWLHRQPVGYEKLMRCENKVFLFLERAGQILVTVSAVIFSDFNLNSISL